MASNPLAISSLTLGPYKGAKGSVRVPGSKSLSNRALLLAALARKQTVLEGVLEAQDTQVMLQALSTLGVNWVRDQDRYTIEGTGGQFPVKSADLFLGNAGTAVRMLTAVLALSQGHYVLRGIPRMHERPIADLVEVLRQIGAQIDYLHEPGFLPLAIRPASLSIQAPLRIRGDVSSQFLTALLVALPLRTGLKTSKSPVSVDIEGALISKPYIDITLKLMNQFGVPVYRAESCEQQGGQNTPRFVVPVCQGYDSPGLVRIEGDASSASYFLAAGALGGGPVRIEGVGSKSIQGDIKFADILAKMGAQIAFGQTWIEASRPVPFAENHALSDLALFKGLDIDCQSIPDAAMTLAVLALFTNGPTTLRGIASWRVKETDRITAMATELEKLGAMVKSGTDFLHITPPLKLMPGVSIDTYDDHRIAMCFSLVSLAGTPITIRDPNCVDKTYPDYFKHFASLVYT